MPRATAHDGVLPFAWALLIGSSALYFLSSNQADNDLWGHVLFGRAFITTGDILRADPYSYTAPGAPWMAHEWLSQVLFYATYALAGGPGLWALKLAVGLGTFVLMLKRVRARTPLPWIWSPVALLAVAVLARGFAIRPQIFSYLGFAGTLWLCDRHGRTGRGLLWLVPLVVVWVNLHGGFVLGVAALGLYSAGELLDAPRPLRWPAAAAFGGAMLATAVNPYGWRLLAYVAGELTAEHPITEWQAAAIGDVSQVTFFLLMGMLLLTLPFARWRERPWEVVLALGAAAMALRHQRHTPVFALAAAAPVAAQLAAAAAWWRRQPVFLSRGAQRLLAMGLVSLAISQLVLQGTRLMHDRFQVVFDPRDYPVGAVRALAASGAALNLAVPLDWGEYVLWHLAPRVKVSLDGRFATVFPPPVVRDNVAFFAGTANWSRLLTAYPTDAAVIPRGAPCPLRQQPGWERVYEDGVAEVYVKSERATAVRLRPSPAPAAGVFP